MRNGEILTHTYIRQGDTIVCRSHISNDTGNATYKNYQYCYNTVSPMYGLSPASPAQFKPSLYTRYIPLPVSYNPKGYDEYSDYNIIPIRVPYHKSCPYAGVILFDYPDVTVRIQMMKHDDEFIVRSVTILCQQDVRFYTTKYPSYMRCNSNGAPEVMKWMKDKLLHRDDGLPAIVEFTPDHHMCISRLRRQPFQELTYHEVVEAWYLSSSTLINNSILQKRYYNNGILIPHHLIDDGVVDPANFDPVVDTFTIEMAAHQ